MPHRASARAYSFPEQVSDSNLQHQVVLTHTIQQMVRHWSSQSRQMLKDRGRIPQRRSGLTRQMPVDDVGYD